MDFFIVGYLFYTSALVFAVERFTGVFFEKERTPRLVLIGSFLLFFILLGIPFLSWNTVIARQIIGVSTIFIISLNYESPMIKRFAFCIRFFVYVASIEWMAVALNFSVYLPRGFFVQGMIPRISPDGFIALSLVVCSGALLISKCKNIKKNSITLPIFWALDIAIPVFSLSIMHLTVLQLSRIAAIAILTMLLVINIIIMFIHNILSIAYEEKLKMELQTQEKEYLMAQCRMMEESVQQVKSIRHDMKLHLSTVKDFATNKKTEMVVDYLGGLLDDIDNSEIYSETGNIAFDSIINFKLNSAKMEDFKPELRLLIPLSVNIEVADIVTIIGNLLDNALEALAYTTDKMLKLDIELIKDSLFIKIDNSFDGVVKYDMGKDGDTRYVVTRKCGNNHGHGLKNVRKSVEKYNGHIDISHHENIFSVGVLLYADIE